MKNHAFRWIFAAAMAAYFLVLFALAQTMRLSDYERAKIAAPSLSGLLLNAATSAFGDDFARLIPLGLIIASAVLVFALILRRLQMLQNAEFCAFCAALAFALCPGVMAAALLLDSSAMMIFAIFVAGWLHESALRCPKTLATKWAFCAVLAVILCLDSSMVVVFLGAFVYFLLRRQNSEAALCAVFLALGVVFYGLDFHGKPRGYFLESLALCAAVFSPPLFLYYFYFIYNLFRNLHFSLLACISAASFVLFLLLSFRQKPDAALFLPLLPAALVPMCEYFVRNYYLHIRANRRKYRLLATFIAAALIFSAAFVIYSGFSQAQFLSRFQK